MSEIDPQQFGEMVANVGNLTKAVEKLEKSIESMSRQIADIPINQADSCRNHVREISDKFVTKEEFNPFKTTLSVMGFGFISLIVTKLWSILTG